ncbi:MAG: thioredoxin family protein [Flavisolibacter sp.]|nr:thioredoxin family protein [Flavisolibacter sp.]
MKKIFFSAMLLLAFALVSFNDTITDLPIGAALPKGEIKMKDISDKMISLKDAADTNGLLVMFSCNTCPYVIRNQERTKEISQYALANKIGVILVNSNEGSRSSDDSYEAMKTYAARQKYTWPYVIDANSVIADAFGAKRTPECFLFNNELKLVYHGAIDDNPQDADAVKRHHLKEAVNEMISGKEVSITTSRSVGCSIKRNG